MTIGSPILRKQELGESGGMGMVGQEVMGRPEERLFLVLSPYGQATCKPTWKDYQLFNYGIEIFQKYLTFLPQISFLYEYRQIIHIILVL